jgi:hypothetical protein
MFTGRISPILRLPVGVGPLGACAPLPDTVDGDAEAAALPALEGEGPPGGTPEDPAVAAELPPPPLPPDDDANLPKPSPDPAAKAAADCARAAVAPNTAKTVLPRSPSTIRFAKKGMSRMQTENRMLAAARRTSAVAPVSSPPNVPALVIAAMLLMLSANARRQKTPYISPHAPMIMKFTAYRRASIPIPKLGIRASTSGPVV